MNKNDLVPFSNLEIGDYFSDKEEVKYRKIPPLELNSSFWPHMTLNAFNIRANAHVSLDDRQTFKFIRHEPWLMHENSGFPNSSVELAELEHQVDSLGKYLEIVENFFQSRIHNYPELSPELPEDINAQDLQELTEIFENSFFVGLFSFLETNLYKQCSYRKNVAVPFDEFKCNEMGIDKVKKYLHEIGSGFPFDTNPYWLEIKSYQKLRNCLVHNNGMISESPRYNALHRYIDAKKNISCIKAFGDDYIILSGEFCWEAWRMVDHLLRIMLFQNQADEIN